MASFVTNEGLYRLIVGGGTAINWDTSTALKMRLGSTSWAPDKDDTSLTGKTAVSGATDQSLAAANTTITKDTTNDRVNFNYTTTVTFSAVTTGSTVGWAVIYVEDAAADASRVPIAYIDVADTPTNNGDITISFASNSNVAFYIANV